MLFYVLVSAVCVSEWTSPHSIRRGQLCPNSTAVRPKLRLKGCCSVVGWGRTSLDEEGEGESVAVQKYDQTVIRNKDRCSFIDGLSMQWTIPPRCFISLIHLRAIDNFRPFIEANCHIFLHLGACWSAFERLLWVWSHCAALGRVISKT